MGHRLIRTLEFAEQENMYKDIRIVRSHNPYCKTCHVTGGNSRKQGGPKHDKLVTKPGSALYLDIVDNPAHQSLSSLDYYPKYLTISDWVSKFFRMMDLTTSTTDDVIHAIERFVSKNLLFKGYTLEEHCSEIHVNAGSQLCFKEFKNWCIAHGIKLFVAGVAHQEMNEANERSWQTCQRLHLLYAMRKAWLALPTPCISIC